MASERPVRVAVIGGGCASISAAFELTRPEHAGKYQVTIYQVGWRLGGKGASGRGPADRIEEHGLHIWLGFYENAFRLLRECYAELDRDPATCPIADWDDAFYPHNFVGLADRAADGSWVDWTALFPAGPGNPGDPLTSRELYSVRGYLVRCTALIRAMLASVRNSGWQDPSSGDLETDHPNGATAGQAVVSEIGRILKYGTLGSCAALLEALELLKSALLLAGRPDEGTLVTFVDRIAAGFRSVLGAALRKDDELRRLWEVVDIVLAVVRGALRFRLMTDPRGFDAINDYDWREWLLHNGASEGSVNSAFLRGAYDLAFAYEDGDLNRPRQAAGLALRGAVRMFFSYRGAFFWKMRAGMGDVVFAPFYEVLKRRGVNFRFFHRLENVHLAPAEQLAPGEKPYVEALQFAVQAEVKEGMEYQPLVSVRGLPCWPSEPDYRQLVDGERFRQEGRDFESHWDHRKVATRTLRVVEDFDFVVLGVGMGAIPYVCREFLDRDPRWRRMVDEVKTVPTQAFQIWMNEDMRALGWTKPEVTLAGYLKPFDTWADMGQLIPMENWEREPKAIAYFCGVLPEHPRVHDNDPYPAQRHKEVRRNAVEFLNTRVAALWPGAVNAAGGFRWELLRDPRGIAGDAAEQPTGENRFDSQFWTANVNPSDRYVLSLPGSLQHRISPLDDTYDNLTITGDWTDCGHQAGCVEAAVMAGRLSAHAISQQPHLEDIVGYDHP